MLVFKVLILQTQNNLSAERTEFCLGNPVPDTNMIGTFREALTKADRDGEVPAVDNASQAVGYQNHIGADRRHWLIRTWRVTDAALS